MRNGTDGHEGVRPMHKTRSILALLLAVLLT
jgi:hypothetical protein